MECKNLATHRFTWPGNDEKLICDAHLPKLKSVASVMGFYLQVLPLSQEDLGLRLECEQEQSAPDKE